MKHKIVCITQVYNEMRKGNLERFVKYVMPLADALVVYDDASTDGSYEHMLNHTPHVIRGLRNDFVNEISHKQVLLEYALKLEPDFILWLDADEVLTRNAASRLQDLCAYCIEKGLDGIIFHEINLWRSHSWRRIDNLYDDLTKVNLWRVVPGIKFAETKAGLHQNQHPTSIKKTAKASNIEVIHYGFASDRQLADKYLTYRSHGQSGWALDRLLDEATLKLEKVPQEIFPEGLWADDEQPEKRSFQGALRDVEQYRSEVLSPGVSIICLVYKSVEWLKFVYEQVLRYTDMSNKEFFFVANDANPAVLDYLRAHYIPHFIWNNSEDQRKEWYINNVYRAWNYGAQAARGDYLLFINTDMAFSQEWFENLFSRLTDTNCICSRLVESGKMTSGEYGLSADFGRTVGNYREAEFLQYTETITEPVTRKGGLYMPLLIRKNDFLGVGGYPEGNIVPGSDLFKPRLARKGQACVSGDTVLMKKLETKGIEHQTAFDSVVYHFQCGEMDDKPSESLVPAPPVIICNDLVQGTMGEKVLWGFLVDQLPAAAGVDMTLAGKEGDFSLNAQRYIRSYYPESNIIIQNATFMDIVDSDKFTISYLQDNLRQMARPSDQQERNLRRANMLVTNSRLTALSYSEFQFEVIPIGVDSNLFIPMDKSVTRRQFGFPSGKIGIFVGDFTETKGWPRIRRIVEKRKDIFWIIVSKGKGDFTAKNCIVYSRIAQAELARLLNCADFFILGSPVETECLAAIEACMCDVPVVMRTTGIFADFTEQERARVGILGDDIESAVDMVFTHPFTPRQVILEKQLTIEGMMARWTALLEKVSTKVAASKARQKSAMEATTTSKLPLVTIITPAYNRASYLDETIQSVLNQDYPNIEYIILDDGSKDNTREVLEKYKGRIIYDTHPNMGETRTVNKGLSMAHGEIVAVVNSDDPLLPGAVSTAVDFMQLHPDILVAYPDWSHIDQDSKVTGHVQVPDYDYLYMVRRHYCTPGPGAFIRRKALELTGGRDPEFKYVADFEYWLRLGLYGPFARIPRTLATFRVHPDSASLSSRGRAMANEHIHLIKKYYSCPDLPPEVLRVRAEAFGQAYLIAFITAGSECWLALKYSLTAVLYYPPIIPRAIMQKLFSLSLKLPKPVNKVLQWGWYKIKPILARKHRSHKGEPHETKG